MEREGIARPRHTAAFFPPEEGTRLQASGPGFRCRGREKSRLPVYSPERKMLPDGCAFTTYNRKMGEIA